MQVKVKKLHESAVLPHHATTGAACFDLVALGDGVPHPKDQHGWIFSTGLAFEIPFGYVMLVFSRSGHGFKEATRLSNCVGVIDSDYRGELKVALRFDASGDHRCAKLRDGDRIAQAMILPIPMVQLVEADELSSTERGAGGFGSTGN
ncbi:deoxyuridine 5'-triphosphate nucleotidohydrolase [Kaistia sp. 32K]|uniref:dUTP diphosphatase n=1 Tax=Kaistia sp. 32K TaxID=2795690 RepID=UPI001915709C|nr:dUTP diphosphatase [Kaistia sp. 32K]BCP56293.1 deoxyuridine 5'-triphosphate nucleotidohydrolase [Kaistia sp. 32K]